MRVSDAGKWGRSRWSSRGFLTFGRLPCLAGRSFSASTVQHADGLKALRILAIERGTRQLLESDLCEASELARMQALPFLGFELFQRLQADLELNSSAL
jgi:hypothetical protein